MAQILVPIFVCVVLPVAIIAIIFGASINSDNKRSQVLIKAIESNCDIDADKLAEALQKPKKRPGKFSISVYSVAVSSRSSALRFAL